MKMNMNLFSMNKMDHVLIYPMGRSWTALYPDTKIVELFATAETSSRWLLPANAGGAKENKIACESRLVFICIINAILVASI